MINELSEKIHKNNVEHGFYEDEKNIGEMLALIHSEVSEALECDRKGKYTCNAVLIKGREMTPIEVLCLTNDESDFKSNFETLIKDTFEDELADIMIRVMDLAAHKGIDLESHIALKMTYNSLRPHKHGKKY